MKGVALVTGGAGFIGSKLCTHLLDVDYSGDCQVICLDNFLTGSKDNIRHLLGDPRFEFHRQDIIADVHPVECDWIFNLACPAAPVHYQSNPVATIRANTVGVANVLEAAFANGARVLQASTSEVYGDPQVHPQKEDYWGNVNPVGLRSCYDEGKRVAETLCMDYHRQFGVDIRIARIFNTYGPGLALDDGRVVSNFIVQALRGEPLTVHGDGTQTRSFCYVDDMVEGLVLLMAADGVTGPVNLGNPEEITVSELAERIIELTGSDSRIEYVPRPSDDPYHRMPDISRAQDLLGWDPGVELDDGLITTIDYFRSVLKG